MLSKEKIIKLFRREDHQAVQRREDHQDAHRKEVHQAAQQGREHQALSKEKNIKLLSKEKNIKLLSKEKNIKLLSKEKIIKLLRVFSSLENCSWHLFELVESLFIPRKQSSSCKTLSSLRSFQWLPIASHIKCFISTFVLLHINVKL